MEESQRVCLVRRGWTGMRMRCSPSLGGDEQGDERGQSPCMRGENELRLWSMYHLWVCAEGKEVREGGSLRSGETEIGVGTSN